MKKRLTILTTCCLLLLASALQAQSREEQKIKRAAQGKTTYTQEETVSFNADLPYQKAIESLSVLSKKFLKKPIIDPSPLSTPIGVEVQPMYWKDALELILRTNNLWYAEKDDFIQIAQISALAASGGEVAPGAAVSVADSGAIYSKIPEVTISAIFVEINTAKLRESGLSFNIFRGRDLNLGIEFQGSSQVTSEIFGATISPTSNKLAVNIDAALRIFESEQIGEVIARPQTTVRSGTKGRLQVGTDFSIKERDFSGNIIDKFFSTGTILEITPKVYRYGTTDFIDLPYHAERSSVTPGAVSTLINKSTADGRRILLNGEEIYVAGLYSNDEASTRDGIPLLKDLPWWVFGLRYIFGYDKVSVTRKELLVLLKAELVPTIDQRIIELSKDRNVIRERLKDSQDDTQKRTTLKKNN
jgi:type IV pilus assembly protein PilQ